MARLLYGTGMRLMEGLSLCVKDIDFDRHAIESPAPSGAPWTAPDLQGRDPAHEGMASTSATGFLRWDICSRRRAAARRGRLAAAASSP